MKKQGLYLPYYFNRQNYNNKYNLPIKKDDDDSYFVSLDIFRNLYTKDINQFNITVKELCLRGGRFKLQNGSPLFPQIYYEDLNKVISVPMDIKSEMYKNIDFTFLNISGFLSYFNVSNNDFFDYIPLEGFKALNLKDGDLLILEKELKKASFEIINAKSRKVKPTKEETSVKEENFYDNIKVQGKNIIINEDINNNDIDTVKEITTNNHQELREGENITTSYKKEEIINKTCELVRDNYFLKGIPTKNLDFNSDIKIFLSDNGIKVIYDIIKSDNKIRLYLLSAENLLNIYNVTISILKNSSFLVLETIKNINSIPILRSVEIEYLLPEERFSSLINHLLKLGLFTLKDFTYCRGLKLFNDPEVNNKAIFELLNQLATIDTKKLNKKYINPDSLAYNSKVTAKKDKKEKKYFGLAIAKDDGFKKYVMYNRISFLTYSEIMATINKMYKTTKTKKVAKESVLIEINKIDSYDWVENDKMKLYTILLGDALSCMKLDYLKEYISHNIYYGQIYIRSTIKELCSIKLQLPMEIKQILIYVIDKIEFFKKLFLNNNYNYAAEFDLDETWMYVFENRINTEKEQTLEQVGNVIGVTRERVRQIEKRISGEINRNFSTNNIELFIQYLKENKEVAIKNVSLKNILIKINSPYFYYDKNFDFLTFKEYETEINEIKISINKAISDNKVVKLKTIQNYLKELTNNSNQDLIQFIIENLTDYLSKNYNVSNNYISSSKINKYDTYLYIIREFYSDDTLDLSNNDGYAFFVDLVNRISPGTIEEDFDFSNKNNNVRSIEAVIERNSDTVIKLDAHKYKHLKSSHIPYSLMDNIYEYITEEVIENNFISNKKIYRKFNNELDKVGYTEKNLYYVLKYLFEDDFTFPGKNSLRIYGKGNEVKTTAEIIYLTLENNNGQMRLDELAELVGMENYSIMQRADNIDSRFQIVNNLVSIKDKSEGYSDTTIKVIKDRFEAMMTEDDYVIVKTLYYNVIFEGNVNKELTKNNDNNPTSFMYLLKRLIPEADGHTHVLFNKDLDQDFFKVYMSEVNKNKNRYNERFHRKEFMEVLENIGYAKVTAAMNLNKYIKEGKLIPINSDYLITRESFNIGHEDLNRINLFLESNKEKLSYLSLSKISYKFGELPRLNYRWSIDLLNYIATQLLNYKKVSISNLNYDADPMIIIEKSSDFNYGDIVRHEMKKFKGYMLEEYILAYLKDKGLIKKKTNVIYDTFYSKGIFKKNEFERIEILDE